MNNGRRIIIIAMLVLGAGLVLASAGCKPKAAGEAASEAGGDHFCPMHPEVSQDEPGTCPKCGMDLITGIGSSDYYCPMHPDVKQTVPGKCPDCGMDLVKRGHEDEHDMGHEH
ncbi:MAG: hypothetical protein JRG91_17075 [Deltaproteobacteria bacterium]|nr:hypothetical protein [Deltaproteobacteria bacterium]